MGTTNLDSLALSGTLETTGATTQTGILTLQTAHSGLLIGAGASGANHSLGATADNAIEYFLNATHTTDAMTHSIRIVSEGGTEYHIMCTTTTTNRTES